MQYRAVTLTIAAAVAVAVACSDDKKTAIVAVTPVSPIVTFKATMSGANEIPSNATTGSGTFTATLDTTTNIFTYDLAFTGLTSNVNNGHIHGPGSATQAVGTIVNFNTLAGATFSFGAAAGAGHGVTVLTTSNQITAAINGDSLKKLLFAGLTYINIHTTQNGGGEIRGQLLKQ